MILIKMFVDKITSMDGKQGNAVVLPLDEARRLRDELVKLIIDNYELLSAKQAPEQNIQVEIVGGKF